MADPILIAQNQTAKTYLLPQRANRHGCITGATGTGKTVTLQVLAEAFSGMGTPVFMADVKGDLSGISQPGQMTPKLAERLQRLGLPEPAAGACPVTLWDVFGEQGHPVRATVSDMGPLLLGRMLELNDTQEGVLNLVFKVADDEGMLLLDLKDLRAMLQDVADAAPSCAPNTAMCRRHRWGRSSAASCGSNLRGPTPSLASRCLMSWIFCAPTPLAEAWSIFLPPTASCRRRACMPSFYSGCGGNLRKPARDRRSRQA